MAYIKTTATDKIISLQKRLRCVQGGTAASKTVSIVLYLIAMAQNDKHPTMTSIVSESLPHLKRGAMRDFLLIMEQHNYYKEERFNKSDLVYTFETGSKIEFFSVDQPEKVRGPRRERLFINEANNIPFETFEQLEIRTTEFIFLDWNPTNEFWFYSEVLGKRNDVDHLILTYKDNEALGQSIVDSIEQRKSRKGWWQVYGLGLLGEVEGKIYRDWAIIDEVPHEARLERYGIDFGYSVDPTSIIGVYKFNNAIILDEVLFQREISNREIANTLRNLPRALVVADSAEPKAIDEINSFGINIIPCAKGRDSVNHGIKLVQDQRISMTKRSVNLIKDYRNYLWEIDRNGVITDVPEHRYSHTMDAVRYAITTMPKLYSSETPKEKEDRMFKEMIKRKQMGRSRERLFIR